MCVRPLALAMGRFSKNGEFTCIKFGDGTLEQKMRAGYQRAKKMTMEQAFEEGKRKEQFITSDEAVRNER